MISRLRRLWVRYHPVVWWVLALKALFGLCFILLVPTYRGPDEAQHVDMIKWYQSHPGYADPTEHTPWSPAVVTSERLVSPGGMPRPPQHTSDAVPRPDRVGFDELGEGPESRTWGNQMSQHPPLFYAGMAAASSLTSLLPGDAWSWDREVYLYRLLTLLTVVSLPLLAAEAALALGLSRRFTAVAASVTLLVPMSTFIGAVVNNDGLAMLFASVAVVGALAYLNRGGMRWAVVTAVGCAGAPLSKTTAATAAVWAVLVVAIAVVRSNGWRPSATGLRHLAVVGVGAAIGFSWLIANVVRFADAQPNGFTRTPSPGYDASVVDFGRVWVARVASSFWGQPARRTGITLAPWMITLLTVAAVALCVLAILRGRRFRMSTSLLALLIVGQVGLMFRTNWTAHLRDGTFPGLQGRYLYALLVPLAALVTVGVSAILGKRFAAHAVPVACAIAAGGVGLHVFLGWSMLTGGYWADDGRGYGGQLRAVLAWSSLPVALTMATLVATALAVAVAGAAALAGLRARSVAQCDAVDLVEAGSR